MLSGESIQSSAQEKKEPMICLTIIKYSENAY